MGMSIFQGKSVRWVSKGDKINTKTKLTYRDQNGNEVDLNLIVMVEKLKKCKKYQEKDTLIKDLESGNLVIGFPIIIALNDIATELGEKEAFEILKIEDKK